jgi:hypothetical protein
MQDLELEVGAPILPNPDKWKSYLYRFLQAEQKCPMDVIYTDYSRLIHV